jgi:hypothetical protein
LCILAAVAAVGFAWTQDQLLGQRLSLYEAVEREGVISIQNASARSEIDQRLEIARRLRDGALGVGTILLVTPVLLGLVRRRNAQIRSAGGKSEEALQDPS